jgi:hypothetical protein
MRWKAARVPVASNLGFLDPELALPVPEPSSAHLTHPELVVWKVPPDFARSVSWLTVTGEPARCRWLNVCRYGRW